MQYNAVCFVWYQLTVLPLYIKDLSMMTSQSTKAIRGHVFIDNPEAYAKATRARIIANANKTFTRTYSDYEAIEAFLAGGRVQCEYDARRITYKEGFVGSLASAYDNYGKLTEKQVLAVRKCIESNNARKAEWADKKALLDASRQHIGTIGEKITLTLTCVHVIALDGVYGTTYINICEDAEKNIVIYKGNANGFPCKGETATIKATVKEHGVRDGVKQTVIQRPKAI
jgi:hypothetical protein